MIVRTHAGQVRGEATTTGARFRGIPYAAAPEGELRFAAPAPAPSWDGVRDARAAGPTAPQRHREIPGLDLSAVVGDGWRPGPEYLTVDVWTPDPGAGSLPVLVFLHGGAFLGGTGSAPVYDGTAFTRAGAVLVTVQYRLGVEGFLPLGEATNLGLRDHLAALRWVGENIAAFGGDPGNVTLFGESAGAISVACLLGSPLSQGLFRRVIVQSGHANLVRGRAELDRLTTAVATGLGVEPTAEAFRGLPTERLLEAQDALLRPGGTPDLRDADGHDRSFGLSPFLPLVGDDVLPVHPGEAIRGGAGGDVDLIAGTCREEMRLYFGPAGLLDVLTEEQAVAMLSASHPDAAGVLAGYGLGDGRTAGEVFVEAMTDLVFGDGVRELVAAHRGRSFRYEFAWQAPKLGACHGMELPFVFDSLAASTSFTGEGAPAELAREVNGAWARFAATGDPGWCAEPAVLG
ncbi:carboxylesterase/lipase family protein [Amycolatopsis solani]|uniref:carboxylesterase/lipase family protein n=1 Tax=Amycolatopsis solani TaxID=3028615 RepID=UPI0025AF1568|nr:carboxylesterase family protein [Amycolatopsis sp. MEP2-6]